MRTYLYITIFLLCASTVTAEEIYDYKILESKDTLVITRNVKPYILSGQIGYSLERNAGDIYYPLMPDDPFDQDDFIYPYNPGWGFGIGFDIMGEYQINDFLAFGIKFSPIIFRSVEYNFNENVSGFLFNNTLSNDSYYFGVEPQIIVKINEMGLDLLIGSRYEMNYKSTSTFSNSFSNTSNILVAKNVDFTPRKELLGFAIEIRKRIYTAISGSNNRIYVSPFLTYSYSPNFFETYGSSSANNSIRIGIAVSLGFDETRYDTLKYEGEENTIPIRQISMRKDIADTGIKGISTFEAKDIDVKIYEPGFAEPHPIDKYSLDQETIDYLNDILHIMKSYDNTVIEILIIQPDKNDVNNESKRKAEAMINYLLKNGGNKNQVVKKTKVDERIIESKIEINILNN
jgi:hypothetical protein